MLVTMAGPVYPGKITEITADDYDLMVDVHLRGTFNTLSADGNEIEGRWQIAGIGSGKFLMIRAAKTARKLSQKKFVQV